MTATDFSRWYDFKNKHTVLLSRHASFYCAPYE